MPCIIQNIPYDATANKHNLCDELLGKCEVKIRLILQFLLKSITWLHNFKNPMSMGLLHPHLAPICALYRKQINWGEIMYQSVCPLFHLPKYIKNCYFILYSMMLPTSWCRMLGCWTEKDLEGSSYDLNELLSLHLCGLGKNVKSLSWQLVSQLTRTQHLQNTSLQLPLNQPVQCCQQYTVSNDEQLVNNELERKWKGAVMASFTILHRHLPVWSEETRENP
jgi:hypothetical protein